MKRFFMISLFLVLAGTFFAQSIEDDTNPKLFKIFNHQIDNQKDLAEAFDFNVGVATTARGVFSGSDINDNGYPEVIFPDYTDGGKFHVFEVTGDNTTSLIYTSPGIGSSSTNAARDIKVADLDGNGDFEVIISINGNGGTDNDVMGLMIYEYSTEADSFLTPYHCMIDSAAMSNRINSEGFDIADIDNDGVPEVMIANNGTGSFDNGYIISFTGHFADNTANWVIEHVQGKTSSVFPWNGSGMSATYGDVDGDDKMEAIFAVWDHGAVAIVEADSADSYTAVGYWQLDTDLNDDVAIDNIVTADIDNDGADEVYTTLYTHGALRGLRYDDVASDYEIFTVATAGNSGAYGITVGDLDDDSFMEIYSASYGSGGVVVHTYNGGDITNPSSFDMSTFGSHASASGSFGLNMPNADLDGDGNKELIVSYVEGGTIAATAYEVPPPVINTFPYTIDFEDGMVPPVDFTNPDGLWSLGTEAHSGAYAARVSYTHTGSAQLISPAVELEANSQITFWWKDDDITAASESIDPDKDEKVAKYRELNGIEVAGHDTTYFEVSTDKITWDIKAVLSSASSMSSYVEEVVDLSEYGTSTIYFRWRDETDASFSAYGTGIDDVLIDVVQEAPPAPATIGAPADSATGVTNVPTLSWNNGGGEPTGYKVYFGTDANPTEMVYDGTESSYTVEEALTYSTEYFWQVIPYNSFGDATNCPVWSFTVMDNPTVTPPFTQDFEDSYPPESWTRYSGYLVESSVLVSSTSGWIQDDFGNVTSPVNKSARNNIYGASRNHWLVTPPVDLGDGSTVYQLDFDLALTEYANTNPATLGADDVFAVVISPDNGVTWSTANILREWSDSTAISTTGEHVIISLEGYTGVVKFGFYGESTLANEDNDLFVDNVTVQEEVELQEMDITVDAGWNIVSVPMNAVSMNASSVFANATEVVEFTGDGYEDATTLETGAGYWANYAASENITVSGTYAVGDIEVTAGWNLVGPFENDIPVSEIVTSPAGILSGSVYKFMGGYKYAETMESGKGYWVFATEAGSIITGSVVPKSAQYAQFAEINSEWNNITVTDAAGNSATLYLADENVTGYEMPPVPPAGIFDVRFSSGKSVESAANNQVINLNSVKYPVKIKANGSDVRISDVLGGSVINANLAAGEEVVISQEVGNLQVSSVEIPTEFGLDQNYPNPFNPVTTIKFSLPSDSKVVVKVYNALGEEVRTLINGTFEAGYHQVNFNASSLSSGVYLYTIEAGEFTSVKKMVLLK